MLRKFQILSVSAALLAALLLSSPAPASPPLGVMLQIEKDSRTGGLPVINGNVCYDAPLYYPSAANPDRWWDDIAEELAYSGVNFMAPCLRGWLPGYNIDAGDPRLMPKMIAAMVRRNLGTTFQMAAFVDTASSWTARRNLDHGLGYAYAQPFDMGDTSNAYYYWNTDLETFYQLTPDAYRFKINGRPPIWLWSMADTFFTNQGNGHCKAMLLDLRAKCLAEFGFNPFIIVDRTWLEKDPACNDAAVIDGVHDWFSMANLGESLYAFNGNTYGVCVPAFRFVAGAANMFIDPRHGQQFVDNLNATVGQGALATFVEGFSDWEENATSWRCADATYYDYPSQRLNILRRFSQNPFPQTLRVEAEACDSYGAPYNLTNTGGEYRVGTLDIEWTSDVDGGWDVFNNQAGGWMQWQELPVPGGAAFNLRYASSVASQVQFSVDSAPGAVVSLPATGGGQAWATVQDSSISFASDGLHTVRLSILSGTNSLDYFDIVRKATPTITPTPSSTALPTPVCAPASCCAGPSNIIITVAGDGTGPSMAHQGDGGPATAAAVGQPMGVCADSGGNIYAAEPFIFQVRKVDASGVIQTIIGNYGTCGNDGDNGPGSLATLCNVGCLRFDSRDNLYMVDFVNYHNQVRRLGPNGIITSVAGGGNAGFSGDGGAAVAAALSVCAALGVDAADNLYIADTGNHRIRRVDAFTGIITTVAGNGTGTFAGDGGPATLASLNLPGGVLALGSTLYIADSGNNRIRQVDLGTGLISTLAGNGTAAYSGDNGPATAASMKDPTGLTSDNCGDLILADTGNNRVREVNLSTGIISLLAGTGAGNYSGDNAAAAACHLHGPADVFFNPCTGNILVADRFNNRVREIVATCVPTATPTSTPVVSATLSPSVTPTFSVSPFFSVTPTATESVSPSLTPTATASFSPTRTATISPTGSPSPLGPPTLTPSPAPAGDATILRVLPLPNPQSRPDLIFSIQMTGGTGTLRATLYSTALRVVAREEFRGPWLSGWNSLSWALPWLKNGMYFAQFSLAAGNPAKPVPLYIIR